MDLSILVLQAQRTMCFHCQNLKKIDNFDFTQIDNRFKDVIKGCKDIFFITFEYKCELDIKFEHMTSGGVFYFTLFHDSKHFLSQTEKLCKKIDENKNYATNSMKKNYKK